MNDLPYFQIPGEISLKDLHLMYVIHVLRAYSGNKVKATKALGISYRTLGNILKGNNIVLGASECNHTIHCPICDGTKRTDYFHQKYCSMDCADEAKRRSSEKKRGAFCSICQQSFDRGYLNQWYCSEPCYDEAKKQRRQEARNKVNTFR